MEVIGKIIAVLPPVSGVSKSGNNWKKQEYVLETLESFPKKVHFDFFGEKADQFPLKLNDTVKLSFDIESREYNGRWYTSIRGWKAEPADGAAMGAQQAPQQFGGGFPTPQPGFGQAAAPGYQQPAPQPGFGQPAAPGYQQPAGGFPTPPATEGASDDLPF